MCVHATQEDEIAIGMWPQASLAMCIIQLCDYMMPIRVHVTATLRALLDFGSHSMLTILVLVFNN